MSVISIWNAVVIHSVNTVNRSTCTDYIKVAVWVESSMAAAFFKNVIQSDVIFYNKSSLLPYEHLVDQLSSSLGTMVSSQWDHPGLQRHRPASQCLGSQVKTPPLNPSLSVQLWWLVFNCWWSVLANRIKWLVRSKHSKNNPTHKMKPCQIWWRLLIITTAKLNPSELNSTEQLPAVMSVSY